MNRMNISIIIEQVQRIAESQAGVNSELVIKEGIVYIIFPDGTWIDFTVPKVNTGPKPGESDSEIKERLRFERTDQERYDSVSVTGSGRKV